MSRPHFEPYSEADQPCKRCTLASFPGGAWYKTLSMDGHTGTSSLKMRFDAGFRRPPEISWSDLELFVLRGSVRIGGNDRAHGK